MNTAIDENAGVHSVAKKDLASFMNSKALINPNVHVALRLYYSIAIRGGCDDDIISTVDVQFSKLNLRPVVWIAASSNAKSSLGATGLHCVDGVHCAPVRKGGGRWHHIELHIKIV